MLISKRPSVHMFSACRSHLVPSREIPNFDSFVWGPVACGCGTGDDVTGVADPVPLFYTVVLHSLCSLLDKAMRVGLGEQKIKTLKYFERCSKSYGSFMSTAGITLALSRDPHSRRDCIGATTNWSMFRSHFGRPIGSKKSSLHFHPWRKGGLC